MRIQVTQTPRRLFQFPRRTLVLLRVLSGTAYFDSRQENLFSGHGIPVQATDGIQNWELPEGELWIASDHIGATVEIIAS